MYFSTFLTQINTLILGFILSSFQKFNSVFSHFQTRRSDSKSGVAGSNSAGAPCARVNFSSSFFLSFFCSFVAYLSLTILLQIKE
jgi:hypothetical protein